MSSSEILNEARRRADQEYDQALAEARTRRDETIQLAREAEKQAIHAAGLSSAEIHQIIAGRAQGMRAAICSWQAGTPSLLPSLQQGAPVCPPQAQ